MRPQKVIPARIPDGNPLEGDALGVQTNTSGPIDRVVDVDDERRKVHAHDWHHFGHTKTRLLVCLPDGRLRGQLTWLDVTGRKIPATRLPRHRGTALEKQHASAVVFDDDGGAVRRHYLP